MRLLFVHSHMFKYYDGRVYSEGQFPYEILKERYLRYFDQLIIAGRGEKVQKTGKLHISSGPNVEHEILPNLSSLKHRRKKILILQKRLKELMYESDALVARMPSVYGLYAIKIARNLNKPYVVEIVGDVFESLWNHGSIFGKILAPYFYLKYKRIIAKAPYLIYVTKDYLQKKYPHNNNAITIYASNVEIPGLSEEALNRRIQRIKKFNTTKTIKIGLIGSYASKYNGMKNTNS